MFLTMTDETTIIVTGAIMAGMLIMTIILIFGVRRDRRRFKEEKSLIIDGLLSRTAINEEISSYLSKARKDEEFSLIRIEIENFDEVINAFGKPEAKRALERVAYFMSRSIPKKCSMGNFQVTNFLVLMKSEYDRSQTYSAAKKLLQVITKPIKVFKNTYINLECSIGVCHYPTHGSKFKELMNSLAIAITDARSKGINQIEVYADGKADAQEGLSFQLALKEAMEQKQFVLFYQPIIDIVNAKFYGVEALVRWDHPTRGLISPQSFLDVMEQSGDINWIGTWGLETLIQEYYEIRREFPYLTYQITFNLSLKQLLSDTIAPEFSKLIKKYKMNPQIIILELAEFNAYQKFATIKQNIAKLKKIGFKISLNAYGIDTNTMMALDEMPIDVIKLDKQFFEKEEESYLKERLLGLIVEWGNKNNKAVIAEGIEDQEMLDLCKEFKIQFIQGFYYSKPISSSEIITYIKDQPWVETDETLNELDEFMSDNFENVLEENGENLDKEDETILDEIPPLSP